MPKIDCLQKAEKDKDVKAYFSSITEDMSESQQRDMAIELANKYYTELNAEVTKFSKSIGHIPKKINQINKSGEIKKIQDEYDAKIKIVEEEINSINSSKNQTVVQSKSESKPTNSSEPSSKVSSGEEGDVVTEKGNIIKRDLEAEKIRNDKGHRSYIITDKEGNKLGSISINERTDLGGYQVEGSAVIDKGKGAGKDAYKSIIGSLDKPLISDSSLTPEATRLWDSLVKEGLAKFDEQQGKYISIKSEQQPTTQEVKPNEPIAEHQVTADEKFSPAQMSDALREEYKKQFPNDVGVEGSNLQEMYDKGDAEFIPVNDKQGLYKLKSEENPQWNKLGSMKDVTMDKAIESLKKDAETISKSESISKDYEDISSMKAEKVKREAMDRLISDNFEDIVAQLISNEKIKKLC